MSKISTLSHFDLSADCRDQPAEFAAQPNSQVRMPTAEAYAFWQGAFSLFNEELFGGALANSLITLSTNRRALGYFCPRAFEDRDGAKAHQIALNPTWFTASGDLGSLSTFAHEMAHQWREDLGPLNRKGGKGAGGYHDRIWADKMQAIGLMPSDTGTPGGKRTGFRVSHYVIEHGAFDRTCTELLGNGIKVNWRDNRALRPDALVLRAAVSPAAISKNTRTRFVCGCCDLKAWSRASAKISCTDCNTPLIAR
jgi:hypothetical protein